MMEYIQTIKSIIVHPQGGELFHENATEVSIEDEGGGYYVVLTQCPDNPEPALIKLDAEEIDVVYAAAQLLLNQHKNNDNNTTN